MYCDEDGGSKVVTSPNYPRSYPENQDKNYPISVEEDQVIEINFTDFVLEYHATCQYDWVTVEDGDGSTLLEKTCGSINPGRITSKTSRASIRFHSDGGVSAQGFRAEWRSVDRT